jgi:acyl-CoA thioester hydrolase
MGNKFNIEIHVRFKDIDSMGHVNNAVFFTYFEEGRKAFFQKISEGAGFPLFPFILAHIDCDFISPITLNSQVSLKVSVKDIGNKSFVLTYRLADTTDDSITYAKGESIQVCYDYKESKSIIVPAELKLKLSEYL